MIEKYKPDRYDLTIIKSLSRSFESAINYYELDLKDFVVNFVKTDIFKNFYEDFTVYSQAPTYAIGKALDELIEKNIQIKKMDKDELQYKIYYAEVARWLGYLLMYWKIKENIDENIFLKYNIDEIIFGYETLHTQSINYAIDFIKKEYYL